MPHRLPQSQTLGGFRWLRQLLRLDLVASLQAVKLVADAAARSRCSSVSRTSRETWASRAHATRVSAALKRGRSPPNPLSCDIFGADDQTPRRQGDWNDLMPLISFEELPDHARLWIFAASRPLASDESAALLHYVDAYLSTWEAHGAPLRVGRDWRYDRFLMVAADESAAGVSGCSIDGLVRSLRGAESRLGITLTHNAPVWYRDGDAIRQVSRTEFRELAKVGAVGLDTTVFDNSLATVAAVRQGRWELAARDSWHGQAFFATASRD